MIGLLIDPSLWFLPETHKCIIDMENLHRIADYLHEHNLTIATAESCTAGLIAAKLADMPGCGTWFKLGYVTYSPTAKNRVLGVRFETIERHNLTSEEVAREMAEGALNKSAADIAIANTGVAGPGDGDGGIPAGTICFAWAFQHGDGTSVTCETRHFPGDRNAVRDAAADYAIGKVLELHAAACGAAKPGITATGQKKKPDKKF